MRPALLSLLLASSAVLTGCNDGPGPAPGETSGGEDPGLEDDELDIAGVELPPLPHGVSVTAEPLEAGIRLARASGEVDRPPLETDATLLDVQRYVDGPLRDWILLRGRALREVRTAFAPIDEGEEGEEGDVVVAAAVIGVLYLRFALDLVELPLPDAVQSDTAARLGIRNALLAMAAPLFEGALGAFGACAASSVRSSDPSLEPWERFCDGAAADAEDAPRPIDAPPPRDASPRDDGGAAGEDGPDPDDED